MTESVMNIPEHGEVSEVDWRTKGTALFGPDVHDWAFVCPVCGHVATVREYREAGSPLMAGFSCIGRAIGGRDAFTEKGPGPCNYAGGGLFRLNPVKVKMEDGSVFEVFAFAQNPADVRTNKK